MFRPTAIDLSIKEVLTLETPRRFKTIGVIVYKGSEYFSLNDGDSQINIHYGQFSADRLEEEKPHRVIVQTRRVGEEVVYTLIAAQPMTPDDVRRYRELVQLERRINRR